MRLLPMVYAFIIALVGAMALGLRPGYPFEGLLLGATITAAMTGFASALLQFSPQRYYLLVAVVAGCVLGLIVRPMLGWAQVLGFGDVRGPVQLIWPVAIVSALVLSRESGMRLPTARRRRPGLE